MSLESMEWVETENLLTTNSICKLGWSFGNMRVSQNNFEFQRRIFNYTQRFSGKKYLLRCECGSRGVCMHPLMMSTHYAVVKMNHMHAAEVYCRVGLKILRFGSKSSKTPKIAIFCKKFDFHRIFYGRRIFWRVSKFFSELQIHISLPQKIFMSIGLLVLKISIGVTPPLTFPGFLSGGGLRP